MAVETLAELFLHDLSLMMDAERQNSRLLLLLAGTIENEPVQSLLRLHEPETVQQIRNIERCFQILNVEPTSVVSEVPRALKSELHTFMQHTQSNMILTAYILTAAVKSEQYEISSYQLLLRQAAALGHDTIKPLLQQNLEQEEAMAQRIRQIS